MYPGSMQSGGQGIYLANITRELARLGHEVHVISAPPYAELDPSVHEHRITSHSFQSMLLDRNAYFGGAPGSHFTPLNFYEFASTRFTFSSLIFTFSLRALVKLTELEGRFGPFDVIHDNQTLSYGVYLARALRGRTVVANVHHPLDIDLANGLQAMRRTPERIKRIAWYPWHMQHLVARRLDGLISGSVPSARLRPGLMQPVYDGVDTAAFYPSDGAERIPHSMLCVGNSEDHNKGIVYLLRALAMLPRTSGAHLYLVGGPSSAPRVAPAEIARLGIEDRVTIVGRVSEPELAAWYRRAQLLVSPSLYEGFGLPAAEATACATPVVATDGGALPEVVAHGVTGCIVPAGAPEPLAVAIDTLLSSPGLCRQMGEAGHQRVLERFTWQQTALETEALYRRVGVGR